MSNKFDKKLDLPSAPGAPATAEDSTFLSADPIETLVTGADQLTNAIPGGQWLKDKATQALGVPGEFIASERSRLQAEHPIASGVGTAGAAALGLAALPLGGAAASAPLAARVATGAGQAAMLTAAYKLGDVADQSALQSSPLRAEQLTHALFSGDAVVNALLVSMLHAPGAITSYASPRIRQLAAKIAASEAGKMFPKAAEALGLPAGGALDVGQLALEKGMLASQGAAGRMLKKAGKTIGAAAQYAQVDETLRARMGDELAQFAETLQGNTTLDSVRRALIKQADAFEAHELGGEQVESIIQKLNGSGTKADKQVYRDAAQKLRGVFAEHLDVVEPQAGAAYRAAVDDYRAYAKMVPEAERGAAKQFAMPSARDLAVKGLLKAIKVGAAESVAGPYVAGGVAAYEALTAIPKKQNYAVFLDKFAKSPPSANFMLRSTQALNSLLSDRPLASAVSTLSHQALQDRYDEVQHVLQQAAVGPDLAGQHLRGRLDFLPPHEADAVTANAVNRLQDAAANLPSGPHPPTAFGIQTGPTDREKRVFLEKFDASFDPYAAIASGRADLIAEAEKHNPEVMHHIKTQLLLKLNGRADIPYETRRKLSALLGVAGTPLQDPAVGGQLQDIIKTRREADSQAGQMHSARQHAASQKQNKASLTRAQKLLEE